MLDSLRRPVLGDRTAARAIDPTLGVPGRPQSGTGQTALLTGRNAPRLLGRHFGPWAPTALRELLTTKSIFQALLAAGRTVTFANAYPHGHYHPDRPAVRRPGAVPLAASAAGVLTRDEASVRGGDALVSSIVTDTWRQYVDPDAPHVTPAEAGRLFVRIASGYDFTFFAHFDTDHVGHRGDAHQAAAVIERVDAFLASLLDHLPDDALLIITSDHGNIEDATTGHTLNPVPLIAVGPGSDEVIRGVRRLHEVAPRIVRMIERRGSRDEVE